jgi:hypothetical protein
MIGTAGSVAIQHSGLEMAEHVIDGVNKDVDRFGQGTSAFLKAQDYYLRLAEGLKPKNRDPIVKVHDGIRVVREDLIGSSKCRGGDLLMSKAKAKTFVYAQPRTGLAGVALAKCAKQHGKKIVLFMAASHRISLHQACCIEEGAIPIFRRCASNNNLSTWGANWAASNKAQFLPLGLKHELVTAALVDAAYSILDPPDEVWYATATGVLARSLQIAWPKAKHFGVLVGRKMQAGELGIANPIIEPLAFGKPEAEANLPPFPCVRSYDAKVWKHIKRRVGKGRNVLFWSVGSDPILKDESVYDETSSWREWGEE